MSAWAYTRPVCRCVGQSVTSLAIAMALSGMPELVSLYNENKLSSTHLLRQQGKEPLHAMQSQVCSIPVHIMNVLALGVLAQGREACIS